MTDLLLDTNHDLVIESGDLQLASGVELLAQRIKQRLWFFRGEWYLNITEGVPYFDEILIKNPIRSRVEAILKSTIAETPGVESLAAFDIDYDNATRTASVTFTVRANGELIELEVQI